MVRQSPRLTFLEREIMEEWERRQEMSRATTRGGEQTGLIGSALRLIEAELFSPLSLDRLAKELGTSIATLLRHFRRELNQTPQEFIRGRRLDEALHQLRSGELQIKEIALLVGYDDLPSFSKAFRRHFGYPPSAARGPRSRS